MKRPANETILAEGDMVTGVNTKFTELFQDRDKLRFRGKSEQFKVPILLECIGKTFSLTLLTCLGT